MQIVRLRTFAQILTDSLHLGQPPVAIAFADALPPGVMPYSGVAPAGCRFWQEATRRVFATVAQDHELCAIGVYTHHLESAPDAFRSVPATRRWPAAGDGTSGVRNHSSGCQHRTHGSEPWVLWRTDLSRRTNAGYRSLCHPGFEAGGLH